MQRITSDVLLALKEGDHEAFREVYIHFKSPIKFFLRMLTRSDFEAEEITQEVFITLWEKHRNIDPGKNIKGYLYTIARNRVLKKLRDAKGMEGYGNLEDFNVADTESPPDDVLISREKEIIIRIAIEHMPAQRKRIMELCRYEGLSNEEIAVRLNISRQNVATHLTYARQDLKKVLTMLTALLMP